MDFLNSSKTMTDGDLLCIVDTWEFIYKHSLDAMMHDLELRSKVKQRSKKCFPKYLQTFDSWILAFYFRHTGNHIYKTFHFVL